MVKDWKLLKIRARLGDDDIDLIAFAIGDDCRDVIGHLNYAVTRKVFIHLKCADIKFPSIDFKTCSEFRRHYRNSISAFHN